MANTTLRQKIVNLENQIASGVLRLKNGDNEIVYQSLDEMKVVLAELKAEEAAQSNPAVRRRKSLRFYTRSGW